MSKNTGAISRVLRAPFLPFKNAFKRFRGYFSDQQEEAPLIDTVQKVVENPSALAEHIDAIRKHLFRSLIALAITTGFSFTFASKIVDIFARPIGGIGSLQAIDVTEPISVFMRVALLSGFTLALPYIVFEIFLFMAPGLTGRERLWGILSLPAVVLFFVGGAAFSYFVLLPKAIPFLLNFMNIQTIPRPSTYIRFVTNLIFWIGISFEFPLVIFLFASLGIVKARALARQWRLAIVIIAIAAALITPTVDPVNMSLVMGPLIMLYLLSILLAMIPSRGRA
jgi:sec-independent protein translocase protein TatC